MSDNAFYNPPQEGGGGSGSRWGMPPSPHHQTIPNHGPSSTMVNPASRATNSVFFMAASHSIPNCVSQSKGENNFY